MSNFNAIRALARSPYWQIIYSRSKEMARIGLFENEIDFTELQVVFLQWLEVYYSLEVDLASKKPHLTREIIEDDIRCDAYLHWRDLISNKSEKELSELENNAPEHTDGSVIFGHRK